MWDKPDDQRITGRALLGHVCLIAAILLVFLGFFLPSHDYAGLGDPVLGGIVSDDARDATAMLATMSVALAGAGMILIRSHGLIVVSAVVLVLGLINLVRLARYY